MWWLEECSCEFHSTIVCFPLCTNESTQFQVCKNLLHNPIVSRSYASIHLTWFSSTQIDPLGTDGLLIHETGIIGKCVRWKSAFPLMSASNMIKIGDNLTEAHFDWLNQEFKSFPCWSGWSEDRMSAVWNWNMNKLNSSPSVAFIHYLFGGFVTESTVERLKMRYK